MRDKPQEFNAFNAKPYVGYVSSGESIEIYEERGKLICRQSKSATAVMGLIVGMILLGAYFAVTSPDMQKYIHKFQTGDMGEKAVIGLVGLLIVFLVGAVLVFAVQKLFENKRILVDAGGKMVFYAGGDPPKRVIRPDDMQDLYLETVSFQGKHQTHYCTILVLQLRSQEKIVLCAGVDKEPIEKFRRDVAARCGIQLAEGTPA